MMADSVEAASKSLKTPTFEKIQKFVNKDIKKIISFEKIEVENKAKYKNTLLTHLSLLIGT